MTFQYNTTWERQIEPLLCFHFYFYLRHSVPLKFLQLFFTFEYRVSTWVLKVKTNIFLCWKVKDLTIIFKHWWVISLFCQISGERVWFRGYMVSKVRGTWFQEYGVHSFEVTGVRSFLLPSTYPASPNIPPMDSIGTALYYKTTIPRAVTGAQILRRW